MATRIYIVIEDGNEKPRLIEASTPAQALRFAAQSLLTVKVADPKTVAKAMAEGVTVEIAGGDDAT